MNTTKKRYSYDGAVRSFDDILSVKWRGQTFAESEKRQEAISATSSASTWGFLRAFPSD